MKGSLGETTMNELWMIDAENTFTRLVANILHVKPKESLRLINVVISEASCPRDVFGIPALIRVFEAGPNGVLAPRLSAACASNAALCLLASFVGERKVGETVVTGGIAIALSHLGTRWWKDRPRNPEDFTEEEKAIVDSSIGFIRIFREQRSFKVEFKKADACFVMEKAWNPLVERIKDYDKNRATKTVDLKNIVGLISRCGELEILTKRLQKWIE